MRRKALATAMFRSRSDSVDSAANGGAALGRAPARASAVRTAVRAALANSILHRCFIATDVFASFYGEGKGFSFLLLAFQLGLQIEVSPFHASTIRSCVHLFIFVCMHSFLLRLVKRGPSVNVHVARTR